MSKGRSNGGGVSSNTHGENIANNYAHQSNHNFEDYKAVNNDQDNLSNKKNKNGKNIK